MSLETDCGATPDCLEHTYLSPEGRSYESSCPCISQLAYLGSQCFKMFENGLTCLAIINQWDTHVDKED